MTSNIGETLKSIHVKSLKALTSPLNYISRAKLWLQILIAMALGITVGTLLSPDIGWLDPKTAITVGEWLSLPGKVFLALIKMVVIPLILASIIRGIAAATNIEQLKSTGIWLAVYFVATTIVAVIIGISVGKIIQPGNYIDSEALLKASPKKQEKIIELNEKLANQEEKAIGFAPAEIPENITNVLPANPISSIVEGEMLQIVIFAIIIGIGLLLLTPQSAKPLLDLFGSIQEVSMAIVGIAMSFAPLAVFGLLAQSMIKTGPQVLIGLFAYAVSVIFALFLLFVFYILIAFFLGKKDFFSFLKAVREPSLMGFSTNSSAATMPITVKNAEEKLNIRSSIVQFVVPVGATINMGGSACYQGLATLFMAQIFGIDLPMSALLALIATAVGASIGTPAVPGVGIIVLSGVLASAGIPLTGLSLIIGIDRILERFRTALNVTGDITACAVMDRFMPGISYEKEKENERDLETNDLAYNETVIKNSK